MLPLIKTKASVKIIGGGGLAPSFCHCFHYQSKFKIGKLIFISIKSWLYAYIYFHVYHHPGILVIFFFLLYFLHFCILMFKTFSLFLVYIRCLHSILVLYVTNYGINKIYFTSLALWKQPCKCANYFVITVSNIYVC